MSRQVENLLPRRGWEAGVHERLGEFLGNVEPGSVAVFDFDNTCIFGDVGELYGHFLVETMRYRYDLEEFWELIDPADGREALRALTERTLRLREGERRDSDLYDRYLAEMAGLYGRRLRRAGKRDCYEWAVRLHVGIGEQQMRRWSTEVIEREWSQPRVAQTFRCRDGHTVEIQRGLRPVVEIVDLMRALEKAGTQVWIVSASNEWTVRAFGSYFGIARERIIGNRVAVEDGILTACMEKPALYREGKVEAIQTEIGRTPDLVVGDAVTDYEMLCAARKVALVIDRGDELLRREGQRRQWLFQRQAELSPQGAR